jgi:hypothetical protein
LRRISKVAGIGQPKSLNLKLFKSRRLLCHPHAWPLPARLERLNRGIFAARMLNTFLWWLHDHALPLEVILVLLSGLIALYADTVRHFLSLPSQKLSTWILKARLLSVNSKLFNLCECHNNSFNTLVHVARAFVFVLLLMGMFLGGIFLEVVAIRSANRAGVEEAYSRFHANLDTSLALIFIVVVCCRLLLLGEFLYRLRNFKGYDHYLMEHVAELEEKLVVAENSGASVSD